METGDFHGRIVARQSMLAASGAAGMGHTSGPSKIQAYPLYCRGAVGLQSRHCRRRYVQSVSYCAVNPSAKGFARPGSTGMRLRAARRY